jgi:phage terminase large subunit
VDVFFDLGRADNTAIWASQRVAMQQRLLRYYEASGTKIPMDDPSGGINHFLREIQSWGYVIGTIWLPHDAKARRLGSKRTIEEIVRAAGFKVRIVAKQSLVDGINAARLLFPNCWFDEIGCEDGLSALRHYRYVVKEGQLSNEPLHDWASDGSDAFRYFALAQGSGRQKSGLAERLADLTRMASRRNEDEFSSRPRASTGWLSR